MQIIVPIYVLQRRSRSSTPPITVRPLFFEAPHFSGAELGRVIGKLANRLRVVLSDQARKATHEELLAWHHPDRVKERVFKLNLDLRDSTAALRIMVVTMRRHGRLFAFSPSLPDLWFDVEGGESLEQRATEVYESFFRERRKETPQYPVARHGIEGKAWIDQLTIDVLPQREASKPVDPLRALLGGEDVSDGAAQLRQVGRCLNWLDVEELTRPIGVDADVRRLSQLLDVGDRRGVVLVGPSGSGKSARIEGAVLSRLKRKRAATHGLVWQLSPARLISGMSYLGQWQERVLAILKHSHHFDHILYFEDVLGLYEAGKTRDSAMCVADTLRAQLDVRPVRILAEMTSEAWAIFRERDRTMADRFVVLPTEALDTRQSLDILIGVRRRLEAQQRCQFDLDVLPEVISMYDRFERTSVLPGKAAAALSRLAARARHGRVTRDDAVGEFQARSGLRPSIIDRRTTINRAAITSRIREQVVGQDEPVKRLVDRILIAAARLNDTTRPLGTFLLVGPTGVGKTQLAKAVARCLFDEGGLIRLDMNELSSPASAARLVGTFDAPDGLLTSAVRRRPHAVLLLDEIEKADPAVLDVLLQALGEARLSDARGRTVDLSGLLILMTSNLGSRESGRGRGFAESEDHNAIAEVHRRAVREFFRPEFFNRIDGVLSFDRLSSETMQSIAWMQFRDILRRDGLQRRSVLIDIAPEAIEQTATRGYDPAMGARALKRQIERDLVRPAAEVLAASSSDQAALLRLYLEEGEVKSRWQSVEFAQRAFETQDLSVDQVCDLAQKYTDEVSAEIDGGPLSFEVSGNGMDPQLLERMTLRDSWHECRDQLRALREANNVPMLQRPQATPIAVPSLRGASGQARFDPKPRAGLKDLQAIDDIQDYLSDSLVALPQSELDSQRDRLVDCLGRLDQQLAARSTAIRWALWMRWYGEEGELRFGEMGDLLGFGGTRFMFSMGIHQWASQEENLLAENVHPDDASVRCFSGALALSTLRELQGSWMFVHRDGELNLADVRICPLRDDVDDEAQLKRWQDEQRHSEIAPVRRVIQVGGPQIDLVTGAVVSEPFSVATLVKLLTMTRRSVNFLVDAGEVTS